MNWTLPTWVVIYHPTLIPAIPSLKANGNGLRFARIIAPHRAYLLSDLRTSPPLKRSQPPHTGLLRVKGKFLDRLTWCQRVKDPVLFLSNIPNFVFKILRIRLKP
ncbi:hypothetical protein AVEN_38903-1 [Araneus ventricosus]|uniref:Uncharacterized protein n=1 Tax=Araneus ventricosus TaxID=182803 RepID=A0A4Y2T3U7_ARAVE|nr:hypothetical protein AVEN_268914-1 [Araneus ventricosus]GBN95262.1 hypothetical protein AVEN_38903-1 [Araneus ventricosus]